MSLPAPLKASQTRNQGISSEYGGIKVRFIEVVSPGVAFEWKNNSTGLKILTNLTVDDINRRDGLIVFKSEAAVWSWARTVANSDNR